MAKVLTPINLANTMENGKMTKRMVKELIHITVAQHTKENTKTTINMVKVILPIKMAHTKVNGKMMKRMVKGLSHITVGQLTKENGKIT